MSTRKAGLWEALESDNVHIPTAIWKPEASEGQRRRSFCQWRTSVKFFPSAHGKNQLYERTNTTGELTALAQVTAVGRFSHLIGRSSHLRFT